MSGDGSFRGAYSSTRCEGAAGCDLRVHPVQPDEHSQYGARPSRVRYGATPLGFRQTEPRVGHIVADRVFDPSTIANRTMASSRQRGSLAAALIQASSYCAEYNAACATESDAKCKACAACQDQSDGAANGRTKDDPESNDAVAPVARSVLAHEFHPLPNPVKVRKALRTYGQEGGKRQGRRSPRR